MAEAGNVRKMSELGRLGGRRSGAVRRKRGELQAIARKILATKFAPPEDMRQALEQIGIVCGDRMTIASGIMSVVSGKALGGDLGAARFVMDIAGYSPESKERLAKIRVLEKSVESFGEECRQLAAPGIQEIETEAERLGVYDD